eukprot:4101427-Pyramimonas_sp.AAC.1
MSYSRGCPLGTPAAPQRRAPMPGKGSSINFSFLLDATTVTTARLLQVELEDAREGSGRAPPPPERKKADG